MRLTHDQPVAVCSGDIRCRVAPLLCCPHVGLDEEERAVAPGEGGFVREDSVGGGARFELAVQPVLSSVALCLQKSSMKANTFSTAALIRGTASVPMCASGRDVWRRAIPGRGDAPLGGVSPAAGSRSKRGQLLCHVVRRMISEKRFPGGANLILPR